MAVLHNDPDESDYKTIQFKQIVHNLPHFVSENAWLMILCNCRTLWPDKQSIHLEDHARAAADASSTDCDFLYQTRRVYATKISLHYTKQTSEGLNHSLYGLFLIIQKYSFSYWSIVEVAAVKHYDGVIPNTTDTL